MGRYIYKRYIILVLMLGLILILGGCKEESKEFVAGEGELIHLTSTPKGGVETYQIYTTNIMIYTDGTVKIYASDFVRWFGNGDIPEMTFSISKEEVEEIKQLIVEHDIYNLREDVGNKDGISGVVKHMTVYSVDGTNTTGGISVSNRQFVRAYDRIEAIVREELFMYTGEIDQIQYKGYVLFCNRKVELIDRDGNTVLDHQYINDVYPYMEEFDGQKTHYVVLEFNQHGGEKLSDVSYYATDEDVIILTLYISDTFETNIAITEPLNDCKLYIPQEGEEAANNLTEKIKANMK